MRRMITSLVLASVIAFAPACASLSVTVQNLITLHAAVRVALVAADVGEETFCQAVPAVPPATAETCANPKDPSATHTKIRADIAKAYVLDADVATGLANIKSGTPIPAQLVQSLTDLNSVLQDALKFDPTLDPSVKALVSVVINTVQAVILSIPPSSATTELLQLQDKVAVQAYSPWTAYQMNVERHRAFAERR